MQALTDENFFRSLAHVIQTDSGTHTIPIVASHGTASWMKENGLYPESDETFDQITLSAYKLGTAIKDIVTLKEKKVTPEEFNKLFEE